MRGGEKKHEVCCVWQRNRQEEGVPLLWGVHVGLSGLYSTLYGFCQRGERVRNIWLFSRERDRGGCLIVYWLVEERAGTFR